MQNSFFMRKVHRIADRNESNQKWADILHPNRLVD